MILMGNTVPAPSLASSGSMALATSDFHPVSVCDARASSRTDPAEVQRAAAEHIVAVQLHQCTADAKSQAREAQHALSQPKPPAHRRGHVLNRGVRWAPPAAAAEVVHLVLDRVTRKSQLLDGELAVELQAVDDTILTRRQVEQGAHGQQTDHERLLVVQRQAQHIGQLPLVDGRVQHDGAALPARRMKDAAFRLDRRVGEPGVDVVQGRVAVGAVDQRDKRGRKRQGGSADVQAEVRRRRMALYVDLIERAGEVALRFQRAVDPLDGVQVGVREVVRAADAAHRRLVGNPGTELPAGGDEAGGLWIGQPRGEADGPVKRRVGELQVVNLERAWRTIGLARLDGERRIARPQRVDHHRGRAMQGTMELGRLAIGPGGSGGIGARPGFRFGRKISSRSSVTEFT